MKKRISILTAIAAALSILSPCLPAFADGEMECSLTCEPGTVLMTGTISIGPVEYPNSVTVSVYDDQDQLNYFDVIYTDLDGHASFSYINDGPSGDYSCYFNVRSRDTTLLTQYSGFKGNTYWSEFLAGLNQAARDQDTAKIAQCLKEYQEELELDTAIFDSLSHPEQVYQIMLQDYSGFQETSDVVNGYQRACYVVCVNEQGMDGLRKLYADDKIYGYFGLGTAIPKGTSGPVLDDLSASTQNAVYQAVCKPQSASQKLIDAFVEETLFAAVKDAVNYGEVKAVVQAYSTAGLLKSNVKQLSSGVYKSLMGRMFSTFAEVDAAIAAYPPATDKDGGGSSNGGGGGHAGGGLAGGGAVLLSKDDAAPQPPRNEGESGPLSGTACFDDLEDSKWALEAIEYLYKAGIVAGTGARNFEPSRNVTRAEMAKMLVLLLELEPSGEPAPFADVDGSEWYAGYVAAACQAGLFQGYEDNTFGVEADITREEAAAVVYRLLTERGMKFEETPFVFDDDAKLSPWAKKPVYALYSRGVIAGRSAAVFAPNEQLTRAESAVLLYHAVKAMEQ